MGDYYSTTLLLRVKQHLATGGVIAYPTESCYGLGCDPFNYRAINKILQLKARSPDKGLIVVASKISQLSKLLSDLPAEDAVQAYWPGRFTLVLPIKRQNVLPNLSGKHAGLAVRVSNQHYVKQLCDYLNAPLVSTSANSSGKISCKTYFECVTHFGAEVLVLPGVIDYLRSPSTIIHWATKQVLR